MVLIVDAMAIRKGTWWDAKQRAYVGRVDYGTGMPEADDDLATEALVFMISGVSGHWKHPIGYFLQNKMSASVQAQLIKDCIGLLSAEKLNVVALVFDGSFTNQSAAVKLGCKMSLSDLQTWFLHPETDNKIHVIFDVCHMVKLLRNLLGDKKVICHEHSGKLEEICWWYIESLNRLQEDLGFSFANKLKNQHIEWTRHKMNVSLAAQTLSSSVAAAIDFLRKESQVETFAGSEATTDFIRKVDLAFDLLNSRNPLAKGYKAPVSHQNLSLWLQRCDMLVSYFLQLKDTEGNFLRENCHKTAIWGMVFSLCSLVTIVQELLTHSENPLRYVLTYKFSQDHLEHLFSKIRQRCGWNNNPNVLQFKYALQRLLLRNSIEPAKTGNCTPFVDVLHQPNGLFVVRSKRHQVSEAGNISVPDSELEKCDHMLSQLDAGSSHDLLDNILFYICGFVIQQILQKLKCVSCRSALLLDPNDPHARSQLQFPQ